MTEALVERASVRNPDSPALEYLRQRLASLANAATVSEGVVVGGDLISGNIVTSGGVAVGDAISSNITVFSRSVPREHLDALPKALPVNSGSRARASLPAPELVFNWALGMRQAMRARPRR